MGIRQPIDDHIKLNVYNMFVKHNKAMYKILKPILLRFLSTTGCKRLIIEGEKVIGIDNLNDYYDMELKKNRINCLGELPSEVDNWNFVEVDLIDKEKNDDKKD